MPAPEYSEIDPAFGHWFAGFVDGEGSFGILSRTGSRSYACRFSLMLRVDDRPIIDEIRASLGGIGWLYELPARGHRQPVVSWAIGTRGDAHVLVGLFDVFPLRAKKARDFAIWREAVAEWNRLGGMCGPSRSDWSYMGELKRQLEEGRKLDATASSPVPPAPPPQLPLSYPRITSRSVSR